MRSLEEEAESMLGFRVDASGIVQCKSIMHCCNFQLALWNLVLKLLAERRWIPVSERLPKNGEKILLLTATGEMAAVERKESEWEGTRFFDQIVTHWQPLPAPPPAEKCGEHVQDLIAGASYYECALPKGHSGGHRAEGECKVHGHYFGEEGAVPQCPRWPDVPAEKGEQK